MSSFLAKRDKRLKRIDEKAVRRRREILKRWDEELEEKRLESLRAKWMSSAHGKSTQAALKVEVRAERENLERKLREQEQEQKRKKSIWSENVCSPLISPGIFCI